MSLTSTVKREMAVDEDVEGRVRAFEVHTCVRITGNCTTNPGDTGRKESK
jgi:hypothetical protein